MKVQINFVEVSPVLAKIQAESLKAEIKSIGGPEDVCYMTAQIDEFISCAWYRSIEQVIGSRHLCLEFQVLLLKVFQTMDRLWTQSTGRSI